MSPKKGYTNKECPGCGSATERRSDSVCYQCLSDIETGRRYKEMCERISKSKGMVKSLVPDAWCAPYYKSVSGETRDECKSHLLSRIIVQIAKLVSLPSPVHASWSYRTYLENKLTFDSDKNANLQLFEGDFSWKSVRYLEQEMFDLLNHLDAAIRDYSQAVYDDGLKTGKGALTMLNAGEITLAEFEKKKQ
jgi:hypothetical protein